jgi:hypothetical protein
MRPKPTHGKSEIFMEAITWDGQFAQLPFVAPFAALVHRFACLGSEFIQCPMIFFSFSDKPND